MIKAERAQTKSGKGVIGYYPRSKLPFRGIHNVSWTMCNWNL